MTTEVEVAVLQNQMDNIEKKVDQGFDGINKRLDGLDNKFAGKWVETPLKLIGGAIGLALVGALMALILR